MKLSRKERKKAADKKRQSYSNQIQLFFMVWFKKGEKRINQRPLEIFKKLFNNFNIIEEHYIKENPADAHLIRSASNMAKKEIKEYFKESF